MVLGEKSNKQTKSHSVKKSGIFCCVLNFEIFSEKEKTCENAAFTQVLELSDALATSTPQKHSRTARLEHFALLLVSSPHYARFTIHRMRSQLRPTEPFDKVVKKNKRQRLSLPLELLVGLEPTTCALRMRCSTN